MKFTEHTTYEYILDTYRYRNKKLLRFLRKYFSRDDHRDLKWHVTVVSEKKALIVTKEAHKLRELILASREGREIRHVKTLRLDHE